MKLVAVKNEIQETETRRLVITTVTFDDGEILTYREGSLDLALLQGALILGLDFTNVLDFESSMDPEELDWDEIETVRPPEERERLEKVKRFNALVRRASVWPESVDTENLVRLKTELAVC